MADPFGAERVLIGSQTASSPVGACGVVVVIALSSFIGDKRGGCWNGLWEKEGFRRL
jgi:hypothetical protein